MIATIDTILRKEVMPHPPLKRMLDTMHGSNNVRIL